MLILNLLPLSEKETLQQEEIQHWISFYGSAILSIMFIFTIFLMIAWFFILIQLNSISTNLDNARHTFKTQGLKEQENKTLALNQRLEKVYRLQQQQKNYSPVLSELINLMPANSRFQGISLNEKGELALAGFASYRDQVVALKEQLEKSSFFKNVDSPLSNITKQTDIDFNFRFEINKDILKNE